MTAPDGAAAPALEVYRVRFEVVSQQALRKYSNADPLLYKNTTQTVPNSQIPDEDWHEVTGARDRQPVAAVQPAPQVGRRRHRVRPQRQARKARLRATMGGSQ